MVSSGRNDVLRFDSINARTVIHRLLILVVGQGRV